MPVDKLPERLERRFSGIGAEWFGEHPGDPFVLIPAGYVREVMASLKEEPDLDFETLMCLSGVHLEESEELELVYHLFSTAQNRRLVVKARVGRSPGKGRMMPVIDTVSHIWPAALWLEREIFDLLGLDFFGHPYMRRLLLPHDWVGHPLLRDYEEQENYRNVSTTRE